MPKPPPTAARQQWFYFCGLCALFAFCLGLLNPVLFLGVPAALLLAAAPVGVGSGPAEPDPRDARPWEQRGE